MKRILLILAGAFFLSSFLKKGNRTEFKALYALEGTWMMQGKRGPAYEEWRKASPVLLTGRSYIVKGTDTLVQEKISLMKTGSGVFYTPTVAGQNNDQPVDFMLTRSEHKTFYFENRKHDFPKRIVYRLAGNDSLLVFIDDGNEAGKKVYFNFKRL